MYDKNFWKRVNLQQITEFIRRGSELPYIQKGTVEERYKRYENDFHENLCKFRDDILNYNWSDCNKKDIAIVTEELWADVIKSDGNLQELAFDMGFQAGLAIQLELLIAKESVNT